MTTPPPAPIRDAHLSIGEEQPQPSEFREWVQFGVLGILGLVLVVLLARSARPEPAGIALRSEALRRAVATSSQVVRWEASR